MRTITLDCLPQTKKISTIFAGIIKAFLMLFLLGSFFISGNTYGQSSYFRQETQSQTAYPWENTNTFLPGIQSNYLQWLTADEGMVGQTGSVQYLPVCAGITIDGNPIDWTNFNTSGCFPSSSYSADVANASNSTDNQFTTGSQDPDDIPLWGWSLGNTNNKGDISNAGAILTTVGTDNILYMCGDRTAINGDAAIGFWFFKDAVGLIGDGISNSTFSGVHKNGDLLILSHFTNGGGLSNIVLYQWPNMTQGDTIPVGVNGFAQVNSTPYPVPLPFHYTTSGGVTGTYPTGAFFEGFLNLTALGITACFQSFLLETRNSQSINASLQDFSTPGNFTVQLTPVPVVADVTPATGITALAPGPDCPSLFELNLLKQNVVNFTVSGAPAGSTYSWTSSPGPSGSPANTSFTFSASTGAATFTVNNIIPFPEALYTFIVTATSPDGCSGKDTVCIAPTAVLPTCNLCGPTNICAGAADQVYCLKSICTNVDPDVLDLADFTYVWSITNKVGTGTVTFVGASTDVACVTTHITGTVTSYTVQLNINGTGPLHINVPPCTISTTVTCPTPTISAAGDNATIECTATPSFTPPTATDDCTGSTTVNNLGDVTGGNSCTKTITRSWDASNACGNHSATVSQTITVVDTQAPDIGQAGDNATIECTASPEFTAPTASDACNGSTVHFLGEVTDGNSCSKTITRSWDATDGCGNHSATRTQIITVVDTQGPTIGDAGDDATIECTATPSFTAPTAADACNGSTVHKLGDDVTQGNSCSKTITRSWDATDGCGNHSETRTQTITVVDTQAPTIGQAGDDATIDCTVTPDFTAPTATDACNGATVNLVSSTTEGTSCTSTIITKKWDATDACGNHSATRTQVITVEGSQAPTIGQAGDDATIECTATPSFTPPTAANACGTADVNFLGEVTDGNSCSKTITRSWDATDACGNHSATRTQTITVVDTQGPTIGQAGDDATIECTATPSFTAPTAVDACNGATVHKLGDDVTGGNACARTITRSWDATDDCGNHSETRTQTITVVDTQAPTIGQAGDDATIECTVAPSFTAPTASDVCGGSTVHFLGEVTDGNSCTKTVTRSWDAVDDCGNHSETRSQTITVVDTQGPTIGSAGADVTIDCTATPSFSPPTAADACNGATVNLLSDQTTAGDCPGAFTETRTWDATDACGNHSSSTVSQTITVSCSCTTGEGCTPGFWKTHPEIWDGIAPDGVTVNFTTTTDFFTYFNITPGTCGLPNTLTMLEAVSLTGGHCRALARQGVAALLSAAAFSDYQFPAGSTDFASLYTLLRNAFLTCNCPDDLIAALNAANSNEIDADGNNVCSALGKLTITTARVTAETPALAVTAYPNPYNDNIRFVIKSAVSGIGNLELYNSIGQKLQTIYTGYIFAGRGQIVEYQVPSLNRTNLIYILKVGNKQVNGKLMHLN